MRELVGFAGFNKHCKLSPFKLDGGVAPDRPRWPCLNDTVWCISGIILLDLYRFCIKPSPQILEIMEICSIKTGSGVGCVYARDGCRVWGGTLIRSLFGDEIIKKDGDLTVMIRANMIERKHPCLIKND